MSMPSVAGQAPGTGWSVVTQRIVTAPNQAGILAQQWEVSFVTSSGQPGLVLVPVTGYNPETVRAAIAQQALVMDQVQALKG